MEEHRLVPMKEGYDQKLFKELYEKTKHLRRKLASQIDEKRFGVDQEEIRSWFDIKFIFTFNKYWGTAKEEQLLGYIIKALQFYKCRILRQAYSVKYSQNIVSADEEFNLEDIEDDDLVEREELVNDILGFLKSRISDNAMMLLELQLNPPPYIQHRLTEMGIHNFTKIPSPLFAEYLGLGTDKDGLHFVDHLKKEINSGILEARTFFQGK